MYIQMLICVNYNCRPINISQIDIVHKYIKNFFLRFNVFCPFSKYNIHFVVKNHRLAKSQCLEKAKRKLFKALSFY